MKKIVQFSKNDSRVASAYRPYSICVITAIRSCKLTHKRRDRERLDIPENSLWKKRMSIDVRGWELNKNHANRRFGPRAAGNEMSTELAYSLGWSLHANEGNARCGGQRVEGT